MYLKTKAITKQITMAIALVGCISLGFAQNKELERTDKTSENKIAESEMSRASLSAIDEEDATSANAKAEEIKMSHNATDNEEVLKAELKDAKQDTQEDNTEGEPEASTINSAIYMFSKSKITTPRTVEGTTVFAYLNNSEDYTFLVRAIKLVGLEETLKGKGPFTVFAPTNAAFNALPEKTLETLLEAENREALKEMLTYHVMPGNQGVNELTRAVNGNGGEARLKTLNGTTLTATLQGDKIVLIGANGVKSTIISGDKTQTNGMVHTINTVVMPN
ncbi:fasciclin domain-containing protein [Bizionia gelidisalsuginis]|uniref:Fasciclin domain-containing protein n=1 Tax=Bizionia gelidisalsuginis TaxID=291188 RepID=A0ABY3MEG6_9FLAO|nr:fasciclin domain-containing protein [Bizionia gelidisalsuginis]TYC17994.1 fasciclin domain-containing protein [Bizionia gelidisalsuginis]